MARTAFAHIDDDVLQNILSRLPATSFASAACVSSCWNRLCNQLLCRPKIASAISLNTSPLVALEEVVDKVLREPIRPHFVSVHAGEGFDLNLALPIIVKKFGTRTPIVLSSVSGVIGRDAVTDEFREVKNAPPLSDEDDEMMEKNLGIILTVGFVPGLKVDAIPLILGKKRDHGAAVEKFLMDVRDFVTSVSGYASPLGIMMFGGLWANQKSIIERLDYAMPDETVIVGHERDQGIILCRSADDMRNMSLNSIDQPDAVALVFVKDRRKAPGILDIQFHLSLSNGLSAIGPIYKAVSVKERAGHASTWLTAKRGGEQEILDGQQILDDIDNELQDRISYPDLYIGVTKKRTYSIGLEKPKTMTSLAFHGVAGGDEEYLYVDGAGIKTGDCFQFYHSDPLLASASVNNVSTAIRSLNLVWNSSHDLRTRTITNSHVKEAFGGFIFCCCGRGESFLEHPNVDSSPFLKNLSGMPFGGIFCCGEIGRGSTTMTVGGLEEETSVRQCLHVYSTVYLVMSYTTAL